MKEKNVKRSPRPRQAGFISPEREEAADENRVAGRNAVRELLESGRDIDKIFIQKGEKEGSIFALIRTARERRIPIAEVERRKLDELSPGIRHQGIVAMAAARDYATVDDMLALAKLRNEAPLLVILDGIEDPHNLGAILRSAECAGAHGVILPKRRSAPLSTIAGKASAGAVEHVKIAKVPNLSTVVKVLKEKGFWIYAADMDGSSVYETDLAGPTALVLGSEGFGISKLLKENSDFVVSILMYAGLTSLNVSVAAGVLLLEAAHQRHKN